MFVTTHRNYEKPVTGNNLITSTSDFASALLLRDNPIVTKSDRVMPHSITQRQKSTAEQSRSNHLPQQTMQKMITRLMAEKQLSIEQLAEQLGISSRKLQQLSTANYATLATEINLPLIKLYCKTKWH